MTFNNTSKVALCVMQNGKALAEDISSGTAVASIKFGTEFIIRVRNRNTRKAVVQIFVKGQNISGNGFVVHPKDFVDIEHPIDNVKKFKFVALDSSEAIEFGENEDDSECTIEARYYLEKENPKAEKVKTVEHHHHHHSYPVPYNPYPYYGYPWCVTWTVNTNSTYHTLGSSSVGFSDSPAMSLSTDTGLNALGQAKAVGYCNATNASLNPSINTSFVNAVMDYATNIQDQPASSVIADLADGCVVDGSVSNQSYGEEYVDIDKSISFTSTLILKGYYTEKVPTEIKAKPNKQSEVPDELKALYKKKLELKKKLLEKEIAELEKQLA